MAWTKPSLIEETRRDETRLHNMVVGTRNVFSSPYSYFLEKKILVDMSISLSIYLVKVTTVNIPHDCLFIGKSSKSFGKFCKVFYVYCLCHVGGLGQCSVSVGRNLFFLAGQTILWLIQSWSLKMLLIEDETR